MKRFFLVVTSLIVLLLSFNSAGWAAPKPTFEKDYDFSKIKAILVFQPKIASEVKEEGLKRELGEVFWENAKLKKVKILSYHDVQLLIQSDTGIDIIELAKQQSEEADILFWQHAPKYVDAALYSNLVQYSTGSRYVEATTRTETYYEKRGSYDSKGNWVVRDYPVRRTYTVPAHYQLTIATKMEISLVDVKTTKTVLRYLDYRYKEPGVWATKTPVSMYERTLENFWAQFQKRF